ncbi:hypothetical protein AB0383_19610 [Amycolatopsis sp. NPDC051373]|uniref:hypothetical protein n=1 Tax=Amycolatopsis sp. NPDC051373 TaxID=3155801 RepID=UPI00344ED095
MAIEVVNGSDKHVYEAANTFNIKDGHLFVYKQNGPRLDPLAAFSPGTWTTVHEVGSYNQEAGSPSVY